MREQMQILGVPVQQSRHAIQFAQNALVQPFLRGQVVQAPPYILAVSVMMLHPRF